MNTETTEEALRAAAQNVAFSSMSASACYQLSCAVDRACAELKANREKLEALAVLERARERADRNDYAPPSLIEELHATHMRFRELPTRGGERTVSAFPL